MMRTSYPSTWALAAAVLALLNGCKPSAHLFNSHPTARISQQLPPMEVVADQGPLVMNDGAEPEDALKIFQRECKNNLLEPTDTATYGYAKMTVKKVSTERTGRGLQALQMATLMLPSVFGAPLEWYNTTLTAEVQVMTAEGVVLGAYTGTGTSRVKVAMYHGYSQSHAPRLADVLALKGALAQIRPQLDTAAVRLRPLLLAGPTVENPTLPTSSASTSSKE